MSPESIFAQISSLITVRHVQSRIVVTLPSDMPTKTASEFSERWLDDHSNDQAVAVCLVTKDGTPVAYNHLLLFSLLLPDDSPTDSTLGDVNDVNCVAPLDFASIISADLPLFDAVEVLLARRKRFLLVVDGATVTGSFRYADVFKPQGVMCLLSLMMELETAALGLCQAFSNQCWGSLGPTRQEKAGAVLRLRLQQDFDAVARRVEKDGAKGSENILIACTTFIDKSTMIGKCELLSDVGRKKLNSIFWARGGGSERMRAPRREPAAGIGPSA